MLERLTGLSDDVRDIVQEFFRDNGMLGSIVAFALFFGAVMTAVVMVVLIAGLLA